MCRSVCGGDLTEAANASDMQILLCVLFFGFACLNESRIPLASRADKRTGFSGEKLHSIQIDVTLIMTLMQALPPSLASAAQAKPLNVYREHFSIITLSISCCDCYVSATFHCVHSIHYYARAHILTVTDEKFGIFSLLGALFLFFRCHCR